MVALLNARLSIGMNVRTKLLTKQANASKIRFLLVEMVFWKMDRNVMTKTLKPTMAALMIVRFSLDGFVEILVVTQNAKLKTLIIVVMG